MKVENLNLKENRILIQEFGLQEKSEGGIIMPEKEQVKREGGTIVAKGPNALLVEVGQEVLFMRHGGPVEISGEEFYLLRDTDVWADVDMTKKIKKSK